MSHNDEIFYGIFKVVEDKAEDSYDIKAMPLSYISDTTGTLNVNKETTISIVDINNKHQSIVNTSSDYIDATWLPDGDQNRISAPDVCVGDIVKIYKIRNSKEFYWKVHAHNTSLRKREKVLFWISSKSGIKANSEKDGYFVLWDSRNKVCHFHTSNTDGEACTYDVIFSTKNGIFSILDNLDNSVILDSVNGILTSTVVKEYNVKTKKVSFDCEDFIIKASKSITMDAPTILDKSVSRYISAASLGLAVTKTTKIDGGGTLDMSGGYIKHNGVPIDSTHRHKETNNITEPPKGN